MAVHHSRRGGIAGVVIGVLVVLDIALFAFLFHRKTRVPPPKPEFSAQAGAFDVDQNSASAEFTVQVKNGLREAVLLSPTLRDPGEPETKNLQKQPERLRAPDAIERLLPVEKPAGQPEGKARNGKPKKRYLMQVAIEDGVHWRPLTPLNADLNPDKAKQISSGNEDEIRFRLEYPEWSEGDKRPRSLTAFPRRVRIRWGMNPEETILVPIDTKLIEAWKQQRHVRNELDSHVARGNEELAREHFENAKAAFESARVTSKFVSKDELRQYYATQAGERLSAAETAIQEVAILVATKKELDTQRKRLDDLRWELGFFEARLKAKNVAEADRFCKKRIDVPSVSKVPVVKYARKRRAELKMLSDALQKQAANLQADFEEFRKKVEAAGGPNAKRIGAPK